MREEALPSTQLKIEESVRQRSNRAAALSGFLVVFSLVVLTIRITQQMRLEVPIRVPFAVMMLCVGVLGFLLSRLRRPNITAVLLLVGLTSTAIGLIVRFNGAFSPLSIAFGFFGLGIVTFILPTEQINRNIILVVTLTLALVIADQFWPLIRQSTTPEVSRLSLGVSVAIMVLFFANFIRLADFITIRYKILMGIFTVAVLSVSAIALSLSLGTQRLLTEETGNDLKQLAEREAVAFGELLLQQVRILETAALNPQLQQLAESQSRQFDGQSAETIAATWQRASQREAQATAVSQTELALALQQISQSFPEHVQVIATDRHGGLIASSVPPDAFYFADESWWQATMADGVGMTHISERPSMQNGDPLLLNIAVPIYAIDDRQEVVGILHSSLNLDKFNDILQMTQFETGNEELSIYISDNLSILFGAEGNVSLDDSTRPDRGVLLREVLNSSTPDQLFMIDGEPHLVRATAVSTHEEVAAIEGLDWYVLAASEEAAIISAVNEQSQLTLLLSLVAIFFSILAALFLGYRITRPIVALTRTAERIEAGDRTIAVDVSSNDEIGQLATALNSMTAELNSTLNQLETRVESRTRALQTASDVSRQLSSILELDKLVTAVVNQVRESYDYYHVQIYLWNEKQTALRMRGGTGQAGASLLAKEHAIDAGKGLVGRAAASKSTIFVPDVRDGRFADSWLPNPLLPNTIAEAAIPIISQNEVIGVLDVQENKVGKLTDEDINVLQLVADQIGVAIRNAESYNKAQIKADQEARILEINRKIQAAGSIETAMQVTISELGKFIGAPTRIRFGASEKDEGAVEEGATSS